MRFYATRGYCAMALLHVEHAFFFSLFIVYFSKRESTPSGVNQGVRFDSC